MIKKGVELIIFTLFVLAASYSQYNSYNYATIIIAGDLMLGRLVSDIIIEKGCDYIWGNTLSILQKADLRLANLETTFTKSTAAVFKLFNFKSDPENICALKAAHIDIVSLANNHSKDFGNEGLIDTIKNLGHVNIAYIGAGLNINQARKPVILTKNNIKIGFLAATDNEPKWAATKDNPGINYFEVTKLNNLLDDIKALKKQVDIVVVSLHWGPNMREYPAQEYINAAHAIINAGADIIHGHSAHILQGIEIYQHKLILYDTGDFVDDYQVDPRLRNDWSALFMVTVSKEKIVSIKIIPTIIDLMQANTASEGTTNKILRRLNQLSKPFNTKIPRDGILKIK